MSFKQEKKNKFKCQNENSSLHNVWIKYNTIKRTFSSVLLLRARTLFLLPQRLKEVKPVLWNLIWAKHGLHLLHTFQQEKYWPAENEIKDRASVDTAALTLHRFYPSTREVSGDHYTADWSNRLSLIQGFQRIYSNTAGHAVGGLIYSTVHIFLF